MEHCQTDTLEMHVEKIIINEYQYYNSSSKRILTLNIIGVLSIWHLDVKASKCRMPRWNTFKNDDDILSIFNRVAFNLDTYYQPDYIEFKARIISGIVKRVNFDTFDWMRDWNIIKCVINLAIEEDNDYQKNRPELLDEIVETLDYLDRDTLSIVLAYQL